MLFGGIHGGLELRQDSDGSTRLRGRFPYGAKATMSDGGRRGRPKKERIAPGAFRYRVERPEEDIHLLAGHSYDRPLASRSSGTLELRDGTDALTFEAVLSPEIKRAQYAGDFLAGLAAGLVTGLSPGFRIPPERAVEEAETVEEEDPSEGNAIIRTINQALLYELSAVTRPAYDEAQIEARNWTPEAMVYTRRPAAWRWR